MYDLDQIKSEFPNGTSPSSPEDAACWGPPARGRYTLSSLKSLIELKDMFFFGSNFSHHF